VAEINTRAPDRQDCIVIMNRSLMTREAAKLKPQETASHRGLADVYKLTGRAVQATREQTEANRLASAFEKAQ
jgi:hypothetical protein